MHPLDSHLSALIDWLRSSEFEPVPATWVPGTTLRHRRSLWGLNAVIAHYLSGGRPGSNTGIAEIDSWIAEAPAMPPSVARACESMRTADRYEDLGLLYSALVPSQNRRSLGTFFTDPTIVQQMIEYWGPESIAPATVIDVGAGVGAYTRAAADAWPTAKVIAVDVNPLTLALLAADAAQSRAADSRPRRRSPQLVLDDFVTWYEREGSSLGENRLIIGNPPYTRLQLIPPGTRTALLKSAAGLCGSRASLSAIITATSVARLGSSDALSFLLPTHWLESDYASALRSRIWSMGDRRVNLHLFSSKLFADARVDAVSLNIGPESNNGNFSLTVEGSESLVRLDRTTPCPPNWRTLFTRGPRPRSAGIGKAKPRTTLGSVANVRRGVATGANQFFAVSESVRDEYGLPRDLLIPLVRKLRDFSTPSISVHDLEALSPKVARWLLSISSDRIEDARVQRYVTHGTSIGVHNSELARRRTNWLDLSSDIHIPEVIIGPMSRGRFQFVGNDAGATITNNLFGLTWHSSTPAATRVSTLNWLRSTEGQDALDDVATSQGEGLKRLGPAALQHLWLPDACAPSASQ